MLVTYWKSLITDGKSHYRNIDGYGGARGAMNFFPCYPGYRSGYADAHRVVHLNILRLTPLSLLGAQLVEPFPFQRQFSYTLYSPQVYTEV